MLGNVFDLLIKIKNSIIEQQNPFINIKEY